MRNTEDIEDFNETTRFKEILETVHAHIQDLCVCIYIQTGISISRTCRRLGVDIKLPKSY